MESLLRLTNEIATDIQNLSHRLHPSKLNYVGLASAARQLCQEFSRQHKIDIECQVQDIPRDIEENISLTLFRTIQESLRNVVKNSQARHVKVELTRLSRVIRTGTAASTCVPREGLDQIESITTRSVPRLTRRDVRFIGVARSA